MLVIFLLTKYMTMVRENIFGFLTSMPKVAVFFSVASVVLNVFIKPVFSDDEGKVTYSTVI